MRVKSLMLLAPTVTESATWHISKFRQKRTAILIQSVQRMIKVKEERQQEETAKKWEYAKNSVSSEHKTHILNHETCIILREQKVGLWSCLRGCWIKTTHCATSCASTDRQSSVKEDLAPTRFSFLFFFFGSKLWTQRNAF